LLVRSPVAERPPRFDDVQPLRCAMQQQPGAAQTWR